jgi:hypothetical protein
MKRNLNSDGEKFHQYEQNQLSPLLKWLNIEKAVGNQGPGLEQTYKCGRVKSG